MLLDRVSLKNEAKGILRGARVSPYLFTLLFMGISLVLSIPLPPRHRSG